MDRRAFLRAGATATAGAGVTAIAGTAAHAAVPASPSYAAPTDRRGRRIRTGVEVLADDGYRLLRGERVGLVSNPTGILPDLRHELDVLHAAPGFELVAAFGPEHGFRGTEPPGGHDDFFVDPRTGIPVYASYTPDNYAKVFTDKRIDTVLFDIQDVGVRFYTYIWTMYRAMAGAAQAGCRFGVLDRPNPIGAAQAWGPMLDPEYATGVGLKPIVQQHGMTVGELAQLFNAEFVPADAGGSADLVVVEMRGWHRRRHYEDAGPPWVLPSPNMPTVDTAMAYPGTCLFEGTNMSEGRGTTRPFELIGAPYVDYHWAGELSGMDLPGVGFREAYFTPGFSKHTGETCGGVQLHVTDGYEFRPIRTAIAMLIAAKRLYAGEFAWRRDSWDDVHPYWIDKLTGSDWVRTAIDDGANTDDVVAGWQDGLRRFRGLRERYLLYH